MKPIQPSALTHSPLSRRHASHLSAALRIQADESTMNARGKMAVVVAVFALGEAMDLSLVHLDRPATFRWKDMQGRFTRQFPKPICPQPVCPAPTCPQPVCPAPSCPQPVFPPAEGSAPSCPPFLWKVLATYDHFQGFGFYKGYNTKMNWYKAKAHCEAEGGHLGIINSQEEANIFKFLWQKYGLTEWTSIGIHNLDDQQWKTVTGVPLSAIGYAMWLYNEPSKGEDHCGAMNGQALFNNIKCTDWSFGFICEVSEEKAFGQ